MGSIPHADNNTATDAVVPKTEPGHDFIDSPSITSDSDLDQEADGVTGNGTDPALHEAPPPQKRKGGRKPIYATSEERKQRNRQAQAAFRERRTEYIKQLETTIQRNEEQLQSLQQNYRTAADECLMLRYKNSLLERVLLEKGIDVQAELALKNSPHPRPIRGPAITGQASPMQKAMMSRQQQARHRPVHAAPIQTVMPSPSSVGSRNFAGSPTVQPTPPSQQSSPATARSPGFGLQGGLSSPGSDLSATQLQQQQQQHHPTQHGHTLPRPPLTAANSHPYSHTPRSHMRSMSSTTSGSMPSSRVSAHSMMPPNYYSASFQKHYDQLEQEYDAQNELLDDMETEEVDPDSFIPNFRLPPTNVGPPPPAPVATQSASHDNPGLGMIDPYDPMLDADPFGLTASMHFPNPYTFPPSHIRR